MEVVLRVKRYADDAPIDYITVHKKQKTFEDLFGNLSIQPPLVLKRITQRKDITLAGSFVNEVKQNAMDLHRERSKLSRVRFINEFRDKVVDKDDIVYYNGEPLRKCRLEELEGKGFVVDEYYMCEETEWKGESIKMEYDESSEEVEVGDSEDSNREDHPWNDYPDEESDSEEEYKSYSSEYEDYEVE